MITHVTCHVVDSVMKGSEGERGKVDLQMRSERDAGPGPTGSHSQSN